MAKANVRQRKNSGQILVVTSLVVVLLLISTVVYVTEIEKNAPTFSADVNLSFAAFKQGIEHTVTSALVNISNGGNPDALEVDLAQFKAVAEGHSYYETLDLECTPVTRLQYVDGVWLSWGTNGVGVSGMVVDVAVDALGFSSSYHSGYTVNVTSSIKVSGSYIQLNETQRQVSLSCSVFNEDKAAPIGNLEVYYEQDAPEGWVPATLPVTAYFGNGTCLTTFTAENATLSGLPVSVHCLDARGVSVWANATCASG
jgi:hypothetical protein